MCGGLLFDLDELEKSEELIFHGIHGGAEESTTQNTCFNFDRRPPKGHASEAISFGAEACCIRSTGPWWPCAIKLYNFGANML